MRFRNFAARVCAALSLGLALVGHAQGDEFDLIISLGEVEGPQQTMRVAPGSYHRIDTYLTNLGPDPAPGRISVTGDQSECPYLVGWYLSEDEYISADEDLQIAGYCPNGLQPGQTLRFWADIYIPVNIVGGFYFWGAIADYNDSVAEIDDTNNVALGNQTVVRGR